MLPSLAERLKKETRTLHAAAERSSFMTLLLRGKIDRSSYCALLRNLHPIYEALEPALERHARHPVIAPVFQPALWRTPKLVEDLLVLHGSSWAQAFDLKPACHRYIERLQEIEATQPMLLLAHAYVRYLGDLSGGQLLRPIVAGSMQSTADEGTAFYDFGDAFEALALKRAFRAGLGEVVVDAAGADALVAEARLAFELHCGLFEEIARSCGIADNPRIAVTLAES